MTLDIYYIISWWFLLFIIGIVSIPLTHLVFRKFTDMGYGLSKVIGSLSITYLLYLAAIFRILPLTNTSLLLTSSFYFLLNLLLLIKFRSEIIKSIREKWKVIIFQEVFFTFGLFLWANVRSYQPDINGLEKFMDYGFINSILRSRFLPPTDMWFSGDPINYYWFGHFFTAILTKLSQIPPSITYNLMLATILGWILTGVFSLSSTLIKALNIKINRRWAYLAGIISAIVVVFAGNFHTPFYMLQKGVDKYWYPDATRFIGYNPDTNDKTIHEFPIYSFVVSDLHPHLMNLPFVILYLALLFNFVWKWESKNKSPIHSILPLGFLLGVFFMTSTWDFGNYVVTTGFVILFIKLKLKGLSLSTLIEVAFTCGLIVVAGIITTLPFIANFESIAQGIEFVKARTPVWQLAILWGFPAIFTIIFSIFAFKKRGEIKIPDVFILALLAASWTLIFLPEIIFVKDIYIASHHRANTVFKLTYQAYVMSYIASGYIAFRTLLWLRGNIKKLILSFWFLILFSSVMYYPWIAVKSYYAGLKTYKGLDGEVWLKNQYPDIFNVITWFRITVEGQPNILEAPGDSYTQFNVISSYTGLPTVSGWFVHEWLWRGTSEIPQARVSDITQIYTSGDINLTKALLDKYKVKYVIIGDFERQKYPTINEQKFNQLGEVIFSSGTTNVFNLNTLPSL